MHKITLLFLLASLPAVSGMGDFFYGFGTYGQLDGEFVTDTLDSSIVCTTVADPDSGDRCDSIISWRNGTRYRIVYPDTQITYAITSDVIDSVFFGRIDTEDTFTVTGTDVGNGSHAFLPANDSVAESGGTVSIYGTADAGNVFSGFSGDTAGGVRVGDTLTVTMTADRAVTLTFTEVPDSSNISFSQPANATITINPLMLRRAANDTTEIVFNAAYHYHFGGWTGDLADSTNDTVNYVFPATGTMTFSATAWIDTHTVTPISGENMAITPLGPLQLPYGATCSLLVTCAPGNVWRVNGGAWNSVLIDTLLIVVAGDTTITGESLVIPIIDSIRKNPNYRNDSSSIYLRGGSSAGIIRNLTTGTNVLQKYWSDTRIDVYTGNWSRGWHQIRVTTEDSLRDTASLYIAIPRKTN